MDMVITLRSMLLAVARRRVVMFMHVRRLACACRIPLRLKVRGTRHIYKLSGRKSGIGEAIEIEDEEWYSEELHVNLLVRHVDPRLGTETVGVSGLKREEPPASMFEVPAGYRTLDDSHPALPAEKNDPDKLGLGQPPE